MPKRKRGSFACRSLAIFVQSLEGTKVVVELRNDTIIRGTIDLVDDRTMSLTMSNVSWEPLQQAKQALPFLFVKGRNVRYIHIPGSLDPDRSITDYRRRQWDAVRASTRANVRVAKGDGGAAELAAQAAAAAMPGGAGGGAQQG